MPVTFSEELNNAGRVINEKYLDVTFDKHSINTLCNEISDNLYGVGMNNRVEDHHHLQKHQQENCTSDHYIVITDAHQSEYKRLIHKTERAEYHRKEWMYYEELALVKDAEDKANLSEVKWSDMYKNDAAVLWKKIDWKN